MDRISGWPVVECLRETSSALDIVCGSAMRAADAPGTGEVVVANFAFWTEPGSGSAREPFATRLAVVS